MRYFMYCEPAGENIGEPVWTIMSEKALTLINSKLDQLIQEADEPKSKRK